MKIHDMPKVDRSRERRMKKLCAICGAKIVVMLHVNRTYIGGHYFGKTPLHTKKEMLRAMKAGSHKVRFGGGTLNVMNKDPKPYKFAEYWECEKCYDKNMKKNNPNNSQIIIYEGGEGQLKIEVRVENETVWLTQVQLTDLFGTTKSNISIHVKNIFKEGELTKEATVKKYLTVQKEGGEMSKEMWNFTISISSLPWGIGLNQRREQHFVDGQRSDFPNTSSRGLSSTAND